ncbi:MAG: restriction endonuclease subunit S [Treponema sp.]|nr:restriction endonuclease subunit S [Treponema sp.]
MFEKLDLKFKKTKFEKDLDVSRVKTKEFSLPLVNAKDGDNGVMYYGRPQDFDSAEMTIDIVNDGAVSTGNVYTQPQCTGVLYNAYLIKPNFETTANVLHFFTTSIFKSIKTKFGYEHKASWERVQDEMITLPVTSTGEMNFDFMESFIRELEEERICELQSYLTVTGLSDYTLTAEEQNTLNAFDSLEWQEFNLESLFGKSTRGKRLKSDDRIEGELPFVTAGEADEGISAFISNDVEVFSKNTTTIDMFGSAKYRNYDYGADDHVAVVHTEDLPKHAAVFVTTACHKSAHNGQFNYGHNFYAKDADTLDIMLPVKDGKPDYDAMETFISAVQKLVIKDVVMYSDKKIAATKGVVK